MVISSQQKAGVKLCPPQEPMGNLVILSSDFENCAKLLKETTTHLFNPLPLNIWRLMCLLELLSGWQQILRMVFPPNIAFQLIEKHSTSKGCCENTFQTVNRGWRRCLIKSVLRLQEGKANLSLPELTRFK